MTTIGMIGSAEADTASKVVCIETPLDASLSPAELLAEVKGVLERLDEWEGILAELEDELAGQRGEAAAALGDLSLERPVRVRRVSDASAIEKVLESDIANHRGPLDPLRKNAHQALREAFDQALRMADEAIEREILRQVGHLEETLDSGIAEYLGDGGMRDLARHCAAVNRIKRPPNDLSTASLHQSPLPTVGTLRACAQIILETL